MPIKDSPKKHLRQSNKKRSRNRGRKSAIRKLSKQIEALLEQGKNKEAKELLPLYQKAVDKAGKNRTIHPNKASRLKAQMSKKLS